ncbi:berberine bridge enzyme-like 8 [Malania oleifera]|uniref:berberine bridge enzyme-like 8 n=1 Tax=Malania oleifera TaxID=397392 RepID=UPI0025AE9996|nr:berberine bridge enzyme-like 8 [Malania oleifera]
MKDFIFFIAFLLMQVSWTTVSSRSVQECLVQCLLSKSDSCNPIAGAIVTPANSSFSSALGFHRRDLRFATPETPKPVAIIAASHESHVQAAILCSKNLSLQIRTWSGGHDYEGLSYISDVPFAILDMSNLRRIDVDVANRTAVVQAGVILGEIYYKVAKESNGTLGFPAGACPSMGTGGHFAGGGYGNMMRNYGLSVDNIINATLVDVNGRILNRWSMGEDLFWAIRGGGAYSFAVVVSWTLNLVTVPTTVTTFGVERAVEEGLTDVVLQWQDVADKIDDKLFIRVALSVRNRTGNGNGAEGKTVVALFYALYLGKAQNLLELMNKKFPKLGLQKKDCIEMRWIQSVLSWFGYPIETPPEVLLDRVPKWLISMKKKSDYVRLPIARTGLESVWKKMVKLEKVEMQWSPYGGAMGRIGESETPFAHRFGIKWKIQYLVGWSEEGPAAVSLYTKLVRDLYAFMTPFVTNSPREAFLNYRDLDIGRNSDEGTDYEAAKVYGEKYFKGNFDRLVEVKTRVDPENFFRNAQSIPVLPY